MHVCLKRIFHDMCNIGCSLSCPACPLRNGMRSNAVTTNSALEEGFHNIRSDASHRATSPEDRSRSSGGRLERLRWWMTLMWGC